MLKLKGPSRPGKKPQEGRRPILREEGKGQAYEDGEDTREQADLRKLFEKAFDAIGEGV